MTRVPTETQHLSLSELEALANFSHLLADVAAKAVMPLFRSDLPVDNKAAGDGARRYDPVTEADKGAEAAMRTAIMTSYPAHGILGEEFEAVRPQARMQWVLDPIDGTRAFILGLPVWGTLIGLTDHGIPLLGMMSQPYTRERFWAAGGEAWFKGPDGHARQMRTRACKVLSDAQLSSTHPDLFAAGFEAERFAAIRRGTRATRYGGDCYAYCMLAAGHIDLVVEAGLKPYDVIALIPIVEAAGGVITTWDGKSAAAGGRIVAAGDPELHKAALAALA